MQCPDLLKQNLSCLNNNRLESCPARNGRWSRWILFSSLPASTKNSLHSC